MARMIIDLSALRDEAEGEFEFEYVESEGPMSTRFDMYGNSAWVSDTGTVEGSPYICKLLRPLVAKYLLTATAAS